MIMFTYMIYIRLKITFSSLLIFQHSSFHHINENKGLKLFWDIK